MKQPYPVRHPPVPQAARRGETSVPDDEPTQAGAKPRLPHDHDESSDSQASASPQHDAIGRKAYANATDGSADTDRGPVVDALYNSKVAPRRSAGSPRR